MHPQLHDWVRSARSICVLTGAGISAESGIPTFRGAGGLWNQRRAEDLATPQAFARDPHLVWEWYDWRRTIVAQAQPNSGHLALAQLENRCPDFTLVTQNVDGLHDRAGSKNILKIHGDLWTLRCTVCDRHWPELRAPLPQCPPVCECGSLARPGVVWFGEALPEDVWRKSLDAAHACDLFLVIGTSAVVYPAASLIPLAKSAGARIIEINLAETPLSSQVDFSWRTSAAKALPQLLTEP